MRILEVTFYSRNVAGQEQFYRDILNLTILEKSDYHFTCQMGYTRVTFRYWHEVNPYHYAITIPANAEYSALEWLKQRVEIQKNGDEELVDFSNWNAMSMYFYDADYNIIEFIARKNLDTAIWQTFSSENLVGVSELGIPVDDIEPIYKQLHRLTGVEIFDGNFDKFCAIGDEEGLFIVIDKNRKKWFPTGDKAYSSPLMCLLQEEGRIRKVGFSSGEGLQLFTESEK